MFEQLERLTGIGLFGLILLTIVVGIVYLLIDFLPAIVAAGRETGVPWTVFFLFNLFLGWTGVGWFLLLIWALASAKRNNEPQPHQILSSPPRPPAKGSLSPAMVDLDQPALGYLWQRKGSQLSVVMCSIGIAAITLMVAGGASWLSSTGFALKSAYFLSSLAGFFTFCLLDLRSVKLHNELGEIRHNTHYENGQRLWQGLVFAAFWPLLMLFLLIAIPFSLRQRAWEKATQHPRPHA